MEKPASKFKWFRRRPTTDGSGNDGSTGDGLTPETGSTNTTVVDDDGLQKGATFFFPPALQPKMLSLGVEYVIDFENYHDDENNVKLLGGPNYFRSNPPYLLGVAGQTVSVDRCAGTVRLGADPSPRRGSGRITLRLTRVTSR